ncbi:MAG: helix-turn-helix domain-containing protein, partial [Alphaproteobacteria bacterium]
MDHKVMLGNKLRRFRQEQGLLQSEMAERIGISPSYLNLIEHNQRPVTVPLLFKLGQAFDFDLREFAGDDDT